MKIFGKTLIPLFLAPVILAACNIFISAPAAIPTDVMETAISTISAVVTEAQTAIPTTTPIPPATLPASPTPLPFTNPSTPMSERIVYYYFVTTAENPRPEGSVVIMPDTYILAPTLSDITYSPDTATNLKTALEAVLNDGRNGWTSSNLQIVGITFGDGHTNVVLQGEYFGVGDVTLIAARMQILMTIFANVSVKTAAVTLNGVSNSMDAKPADHIFTRYEIETFMKEHAYVSP